MPGFVYTAVLAVVLPLVAAQLPPTPSSWPHDYPGKPSGDFSPEWQSCRHFAGNIAVNRPGHPNNTLFFWALEKDNGSLTVGADDRSDVPWGIWLNGGPGSSSLLGFLYENGPLRMQPDSSIKENKFSWDGLADYIWIDQPVGTGWSTTDSDGYVHDEDEMGRDFMGFLENLVKVFPSLKKRPLYLTGESYSGTYIPYIMKTYFGLTDPPVNIAKFAIGDGTIGSEAVFEILPTASALRANVNTLETYPQLIGYDPEVFEWFREQEHLCGYDLNLTYPQDGHFPTLQLIEPSNPTRTIEYAKANSKHFMKALTRLALGKSAHSMRAIEDRSRLSRAGNLAELVAPLQRRAEHAGNQKRDLSLRANGTIDPWYGCFLFDEMVEYAINYTSPWREHADINTWQGFDVYQVTDALSPESPIDGSPFLNDPRTRAALHAPTSKNWAGGIVYPFLGDPVNGIDPSTCRGFTLLREFILGNNQTGLVTLANGAVRVLGGEIAALAVDALRATDAVFVGSVTTQSTFLYPAATVDAWNNYIATATATVLAVVPSSVAVAAEQNGAGPLRAAGASFAALGAAFVVSLLMFA
ncbi:Vitellogenic carboxypeptidase [Trametes pubescens]|uniref:Vitellogenic carboxypeptidase n=1 Tax=Trametes pubescens TaxID=154538 RepID=A0A1M2VQA2_TRAPU|nr:Vitellogenic carboxypeptidase [Trametes pubescens]